MPWQRAAVEVGSAVDHTGDDAQPLAESNLGERLHLEGNSRQLRHPGSKKHSRDAMEVTLMACVLLVRGSDLTLGKEMTAFSPFVNRPALRSLRSDASQ
jgi:hypothetical protein